MLYRLWYTAPVQLRRSTDVRNWRECCLVVWGCVAPVATFELWADQRPVTVYLPVPDGRWLRCRHRDDSCSVFVGHDVQQTLDSSPPVLQEACSSSGMMILDSDWEVSGPVGFVGPKGLSNSYERREGPSHLAMLIFTEHPGLSHRL